MTFTKERIVCETFDWLIDWLIDQVDSITIVFLLE